MNRKERGNVPIYRVRGENISSYCKIYQYIAILRISILNIELDCISYSYITVLPKMQRIVGHSYICEKKL